MSKYLFQYCQKIVVLTEEKDHLLLAKRKGEADYDGTFSFIGGKMETTDTSILEALRREKNEEVGEDFRIRILPTLSLNILFQKKDGSLMIIPHYLAFHVDGEVALSDEYSEYQWVPLKSLGQFEPKIRNIPETTEQVAKFAEISSDGDSF